MKLTILSVILLTALVELASSVAIAQRGLSSGQSADRPSAPSNTRVAQNSAPPDPGELFRDCDNCPELVVVPPGDFVMGSNETPYEKPEHSISIRKPFAIGRREVTFAEWDQCADAGACKARPDDHGWGRGDRPVINVSWEDAKLFVAWLSQKTGQKYRLPSEAEWEYAARAGTRTPFWWGREVGAGKAQCDTCGSPTKQQDSARWLVPAKRLRALRHIRQCGGMGRGLLEQLLSQCTEGRFALDVGRLPPAGAARGQLPEQGQRRQISGEVSLRC